MSYFVRPHSKEQDRCGVGGLSQVVHRNESHVSSLGFHNPSKFPSKIRHPFVVAR